MRLQFAALALIQEDRGDSGDRERPTERELTHTPRWVMPSPALARGMNAQASYPERPAQTTPSDLRNGRKRVS
jgi:hypothetical protein